MSCTSHFVSPRSSRAAKPGHRAEFLAQGLFSPALTLAGSPGWRGAVINAGTAAMPWMAKPFLRALGCSAGPLGGCPIGTALCFGVRVSPLAPSFPMYSVVMKDISRAEVTAPSSGAAVLQGPPRAGGPGVAQNQQTGYFARKRGAAMSARAKE